jgi:aspartyl protease family protein
MRAVLCFLIFVAVVCAGLSAEISKRFTKPGDHSATKPADRGAVAMASPPRVAMPTQISTGGRTVQLEGDARGHFRVDARVDGRSIDFLVDTGASAVVIRESDAARLGIFPRPSEYIGRTQTANGVAKYAPVRLNRIEINGITVRDVDAAVMDDDALKTNLLGMTFLRQVKFSQAHGRLVLEQ